LRDNIVILIPDSGIRALGSLSLIRCNYCSRLLFSRVVVYFCNDC